MKKKKKIVLYAMFILFISGCATQPKITEPPIVKEAASIIKQEPSLAPSSLTPAVTSSSVIMTYSQITDLIGEFLDIRPTEGVSGEPVFLGTSETNLVTLEIVGDKNNVSQASMKLVYPKGVEAINADLNNAIMLRFLKNIAPEIEGWPDRVKEIINKFSSMQQGERDEESIVLDRKIIQILYDKSIDSIIVTVRRR